MPYERCMGLMVQDDASYNEYREQMRPLLERHQGRFRYDFRVAQTLFSESVAPINRVFVIAFPDKGSNDAFFADPDYQRVRARWFEPAVAAVTLLMQNPSA